MYDGDGIWHGATEELTDYDFCPQCSAQVEDEPTCWDCGGWLHAAVEQLIASWRELLDVDAYTAQAA